MTHVAVPGLITGSALCTPLGLTVAAAEAAVRAGILPIAETPTLGRGGEPLRACALDLLDRGLARGDRLHQLAALALDELGPTLGDGDGPSPAVFLAMPDPAEDDEDGSGEAAKAAVLGLLAERIPGGPEGVWLFRQGRSAFFFALQAALEAIAEGRHAAALVGAVDSLCAPATLRRLDAAQRLIGASPRGGVIPGEGAGFVLIERAYPARVSNRVASAAVVAVATGHETHHFLQDEPNRADGLTAVFRMLAEHPWGRGRRADVLMTCETGESFWAEELSLAYLRNPSLMPEPFTRTMAAEAFGDVGAAAGAVLMAVGVQGLARLTKQDDPPLLLVCGSSDDGHVGGCLVQGALRRDKDQR